MLNRWLAYKREERTGIPRMGTKRPSSAASVESVQECERWRMSLIKEIGRKMMQIQSESLGEQRIKDMNDDINRCLREKAAWERRILELGGPNYRKFERIADEEFMAELEPRPGNDDIGYVYKYFGASRNLPGIKELFTKKEEERAAKRRRFDYSIADAEYYGLKDDDSEHLQSLESEAEKKAVEKAVKTWEKENQIKLKEKGAFATPADAELDLVSHMPVPSKEEIEKLVVAKKKQELLKKFVGDTK